MKTEPTDNVDKKIPNSEKWSIFDQKIPNSPKWILGEIRTPVGVESADYDYAVDLVARNNEDNNKAKAVVDVDGDSNTVRIEMSQEYSSQILWAYLGLKFRKIEKVLEEQQEAFEEFKMGNFEAFMKQMHVFTKRLEDQNDSLVGGFDMFHFETDKLEERLKKVEKIQAKMEPRVELLEEIESKRESEGDKPHRSKRKRVRQEERPVAEPVVEEPKAKRPRDNREVVMNIRALISFLEAFANEAL